MVMKRRTRSTAATAAESNDESPSQPLQPSTSPVSIDFKPSSEHLFSTASRKIACRRLLSHVLVGTLALIVGWVGKAAVCASADGKPKQVADPPWWLEKGEDDWFSRTYVPNLPSVRNLTQKNFFTGMCGRYRFDEELLPTASVIVTVQNEQDGMLMLTVNTVLARTPSSLLKEILIVDDNGVGEIRGKVNETEFEELTKISPKVKIIRNEEREGVARCRMKGARAATADVLVFIDSHVEMLSATWLQHLLLPITENPNTLAAQTLDIISDLDWSYGPGSGDLLYGVITDDFWFGYQRSRFGGRDDKGPEREVPGRRLPYETPFAAGSLFAVRKDVFFRVGGYDEGMYVWGGENTDFAIKMWCCGGRLVMVPCSRVGHMYRIHLKEVGRWPPDLPLSLTEKIGLGDSESFYINRRPADNFTKIITRNNIRVLERWAKTSNARSGYYRRVFGTEELPEDWRQFADEMSKDKYAMEQDAAIRRNGCKNFDWFDKHVYVKLTGVHHPWHPESPGKTWV